jgi:hypothetical protein
MNRATYLIFFFLLSFLAGDSQAYFVRLNWTAPGDDGVFGRASHYDIRYSDSTVTEDNWYLATRIDYAPSPGNSGQSQYYIVTDLDPATSYYFAIKTADDLYNWSPLSNVVQKTTPEFCCFGVTGNVDCDPNDNVDLGDLTAMISYLFIEPKPLCCPEEANVDGDEFGSIDLGDLTFLILHLFQSPLEQPSCR